MPLLSAHTMTTRSTSRRLQWSLQSQDQRMNYPASSCDRVVNASLRHHLGTNLLRTPSDQRFAQSLSRQAPGIIVVVFYALTRIWLLLTCALMQGSQQACTIRASPLVLRALSIQLSHVLCRVNAVLEDVASRASLLCDSRPLAARVISLLQGLPAAAKQCSTLPTVGAKFCTLTNVQ